MNKILTAVEGETGIEYISNPYSAKTKQILKYNGLEIDSIYRVVRTNGTEIELTNYEFGILYLLARNPGQVFSREQIYTHVWSSPYYGAEDNVMSLIRRIRKKIEPDPARPTYILTVWGVGYRFNPHVARETI